MDGLRSIARRLNRVTAIQTDDVYTCFNQCLICQQQADEHPMLCQYCFKYLPLFDYHHLAGDLLNWPEFNRLYRKCHFDHLVSIAPYRFPLNYWLSQFKYHNRLELRKLLAHLMAITTTNIVNSAPSKVPTPFQSVNLVCSVPIHIEKWQVRGFNQVLPLAQACAKSLGVDYCDDIIYRVNNSSAQAELNGSARRKNVKNAFKVGECERILNRHIMLVDDVVTTGATASELSRLLKAAGARKVTLCTLCISC